MRICVVYDTEKLVHREHKVGRYLLDEGDAVSLLSETEQQAYGVVDYPSVEVDYLGRIGAAFKDHNKAIIRRDLEKMLKAIHKMNEK